MLRDANGTRCRARRAAIAPIRICILHRLTPQDPPSTFRCAVA